MDSTPGYSLTFPNFSLTFFRAEQRRRRCKALEQDTDWKEVMQLLLSALETHPTSKYLVCRLATQLLEAWALEQAGDYQIQLKIKTTLLDCCDYNRLTDTHKSVVLS